MTKADLNKLIEATKGMETMQDTVVVDTNLTLEHWFRYLDLAGHPLEFERDGKTYILALKETTDER